MKVIFIVAVLLLIPTFGQAAYQNPTVERNEPTPYGATKLTFLFTGDAGEPVVRRDYTINAGSTATTLRNWIDATINELNLMRTTAVLPALQPGQVLPRLATVAPVPTAKQVWRSKVNTYNDACKSSFLGGVATACAALKLDIEATYQAGVLD
jgi:hypothetical protein